MLKNKHDAVAVIFANSYDNEVPSLVNERLMASIPFAGRYRLIDFTLSSLVDCSLWKILLNKTLDFYKKKIFLFFLNLLFLNFCLL